VFYINSLEHVYIYIEKEIVENFSFDSIMNEFKDLKKKDNPLYMCDFFYRYMVILNYFFIFIVLTTIIKYINF